MNLRITADGKLKVLSPPRDEQVFTKRFVIRMVERGLAELLGDELILKATPNAVHYDIVREPGTYCTICGEKLESDPSGQMARLHVLQYHKDEEMPEEHPAGYFTSNGFVCRLKGA